MRTQGEYQGIYYRLCGWCIYNLSYKYKMCTDDNENVYIYADSMKDLKFQITKNR